MGGKGLNSIRVRFTLLVGAMGALITLWHVYDDHMLNGFAMADSHVWAEVFLSGAIPAIIIFLATSKLIGLIEALRNSTDAIAAGDFNAEIDVNCACEIGGLADSFRTMVARLNSNILRMNVLAYSDRVTELPNRAVISHVLWQAMRLDKHEPTAGTLMFIDLDNFKQVNDTLGHDGGDELLRQASRRILSRGFDRTPETIDSCMTPLGDLCDRPPKDIVFARFAGDEFVAFLPGVTQRAELETFCRRIIDGFKEPFRIGNTDVLVGASIGMASTPQDTGDPAELLNFADLAMYAAKQSGRQCYAFFDSTLREKAIQRVNIERELRSAILKDEIIAHFQPKVDARKNELVGVEALARWNHPTRGVLPPSEFIEVAEQSGLIESLGEAMLRQAMAQCAAWEREGRPLKVSINVSQLQFQKQDFFDKIEALLAEAKVSPALIELEVTESAALVDPGRTTDVLGRCRAKGLSVAIDDFGCGFSNLSLLARLPFDTLKVDRSLVQNIGLDDRAESVIKAIIHMGHDLGHEIVAEGVETLKQLTFLHQQNCDIVQGFLFARPMSAASFAAWKASRSHSPIADQIARTEERLRAN